MPFSYAQYAGNGSTTTFSVPFPYLLKAHVKLYTGFNILTGAYTTLLVDGVDYTWTSTTQVQTTVAPANGVTLTVIRDTPDSTQLVPWQDGSNLVADDMNIADLQNLYVVQEQQDRNDAGITQSTAAAAAATAATTASASAVTTANAASAAAAGAVSTANAANAASANALSVANTKGDQAINTANAASAAAANAVSTANAANTAATNAVASAAAANATAASAVTTAGNADVKADAAIAAVASSVNYTAVVNVAAIPASPANNTYIEVQNTTGLESFSPLAGRPAGFVGDAGLKARLRYTSSGSTWNWIDYAPSDSDARYLKKAGGTMTGKITLDGAPIAPLHPATKGYVDGNVSALQGDIGTVSTAAAAAQSTANTAVSNAATAQSTANTAVSNAAAAQTTANAALPKAGGTMSGSITFAGGQTFPTSGITAATTSSSGIVQLSDSTSAASSSTAATSAAVKAVQDFAQVVSATANAAMPKAGGVFSGPVTIPFAQAGTGAVTRTVDSRLKDWVSIKDFGASPTNTAAQNKAAIQAAINYVHGNGGGTVYFPSGVYETTQINLGITATALQNPLTLQGEAGSVLKRPNAASDPKVHILSTTDTKWNSATDSPLIVIRGLTFDGNRDNNTPWSNYEREQWHCLFIDANVASAGRVNVSIEDCRFINSPGDGVSVYANARVKITNCTGRDCFRGVVTIHGGHSETFITNLSCETSSGQGLHIESDGPGYGGSNRCDVFVDGCRAPNASFGAGDGSKVLVNNFTMIGPGVSWYADGGYHRYANCYFKLGRGDGNRVVYPTDVRFDNCVFENEYDNLGAGGSYGLWVYQTTGPTRTNNRLVFSGCRFFSNANVAANSPNVNYGMWILADTPANKNIVIVDDCIFESSLATGIRTRGNVVFLRNLYINSPTAVLYEYYDQGHDVTIDGVEVGPDCTTWAFINYADSGSVFKIRNINVDETKATIATSSGYLLGTYIGNRIIHRASAPVDNVTQLLPNDIHQLKTVTLGSAYRYIGKYIANSGTYYRTLDSIAAL